MLIALSILFTAHIFLSAFAYTHIKAQFKNEQRARIKLAVKLKALEASWQGSDLSERIARVQNQVNSLSLRK